MSDGLAAAVGQKVHSDVGDHSVGNGDHSDNAHGMIDSIQSFIVAPPEEWCVGLVCRWVLETTDNVTIARIYNWAIGVPLKLIFIGLLAYAVNWLLRKVFARVVKRFSASLDRSGEETPTQAQRSKRRMHSLQTVGTSVATTVVNTIAVIFALDMTGFDVMPLLASVGIFSLAVGFGARKLVEDLFAGIAMLIEDQFAVGDRIDVGVAEGIVEHISLRSVVLRDSNGILWHVSNSEIPKVGNESQIWARALINLVVNHDVEVNEFLIEVKRIADQVANRDEWHAYVVDAPRIYGIQEFSVDAMTVRIGVRIRPRRRRQFERELRTELISQLQNTDAFRFISVIKQTK